MDFMEHGRFCLRNNSLLWIYGILLLALTEKYPSLAVNMAMSLGENGLTDEGSSPNAAVLSSYLFPHLNRSHKPWDPSKRYWSFLDAYPKQTRYMKKIYDSMNRLYDVVDGENLDTKGSPLILGIIADKVIPDEDGRSIILWFNAEKTLKPRPLQAELVTGSFGGVDYHVTDVTQQVGRSLPNALVSGRLRLNLVFSFGFWNVQMWLLFRQKPLLVLYYGIDPDRLRRLPSVHRAHPPPPPPRSRRSHHHTSSSESPDKIMSTLPPLPSPPPPPPLLPAALPHSSKRFCRLHSWVIDIQELGWDRWTVAPTQFQPNYCLGQCPPVETDKPFKASQNAMIRALYHSIQDVVQSIHVPKPCCVPIKLRSASIIYRDNEIMVIRQIENLIAEDCGCV